MNWKNLLLLSLGGIAVWKIIQYATDTDFGDGEYPKNVRLELIDDHVARGGSYCPRCDQRVLRTALSVDHIWPMSKGGRTSLNNAQVICRACNSSKGNRMSVVDMLRGVR